MCHEFCQLNRGFALRMRKVPRKYGRPQVCGVVGHHLLAHILSGPRANLAAWVECGGSKRPGNWQDKGRAIAWAVLFETKGSAWRGVHVAWQKRPSEIGDLFEKPSCFPRASRPSPTAFHGLFPRTIPCYSRLIQLIWRVGFHGIRELGHSLLAGREKG